MAVLSIYNCLLVIIDIRYRIYVIWYLAYPGKLLAFYHCAP
jgi:hypothetical protein